MGPDTKVSQKFSFLLAPPQKKKWMSRVLRPGVLFLVLFIWGILQFSQGSFIFKKPHKPHKGHHKSPPPDEAFSWENITPEKHLVYHPCFDEYQCARLEVPMDWNRTDGKGATVEVAVIRLPAKVPVTDPRYGGPIILNPGGPSGSGVSQAIKRGRMLQDLVDFGESPESPNSQSEDAKYFDIVSFDPRGVNNTTPAFSCFANPEDRIAWTFQTIAEGNIASSDIAFDTLWARGQALGETCTNPSLFDKDESEWLGRFMNTPTVIADMVELVERHGEWRENETKKLLKKSCAHKLPRAEKKKVLEKNSWKRGEERLLYWGFSYGTVIGATFAALQPNKIHRLIVDGVVDSYDFYAGNWLANLQDSDGALNTFFENCHEAGPQSCPFASDDLQDLKDRFQRVLEDLKRSPLAVPASKSRGPEIVTYSDIHTLVFSSLYSPVDSYPLVAQVFTDLSQRNGSSAADFKAYARKEGIDEKHAKEVLSSVLCTDGADFRGMNKSEYREYLKALEDQGHFIGDDWAALRLSCPGWNIRPAWEFNAPLKCRVDSLILKFYIKIQRATAHFLLNPIARLE
ncbi:uncharacterized protein N7483_005367 [Penicillium malachiteum]|uniref:uncharacterized protein n=1 Tax=Penicillium malachiteum TaxID=1324776 RepID=UPI00254952B4|nr:uncharacterized protein N7483_005367 [Penicillium malachiteum]KAJ5730859.1 hypothetical protein N7483_005367 [Penicillium malachiteum]